MRRPPPFGLSVRFFHPSTRAHLDRGFPHASDCVGGSALPRTVGFPLFFVSLLGLETSFPFAHVATCIHLLCHDNLPSHRAYQRWIISSESETLSAPQPCAYIRRMFQIPPLGSGIPHTGLFPSPQIARDAGTPYSGILDVNPTYRARHRQ